MTSTTTKYRRVIGKLIPSWTPQNATAVTYNPVKLASLTPPSMVVTQQANAFRDSNTNIVDTINETWDYYNPLPVEFYYAMNLNLWPNPSKIESPGNLVMENDPEFQEADKRNNVRSNFDFSWLSYPEKALLLGGVIAWLYFFYCKP